MSANIFKFTSPIEFSNEPDSKEVTARNFTGVAYSGGPLDGCERESIIDLSSTAVVGSLPLLLEHDRNAIIGTISSINNDGNRVLISGQLFNDIDNAAKEVALKSGKGIKYQLSVGLWGAAYSTQKDPSINGVQFNGTYDVLTGGTIRETSVVVLGADKNTNISFFTQPKEINMPEIQQSNALELALDKAEKAVKRAEAAEAALSARLHAEREKDIKSLFNSVNLEYTQAKAQVYMDLSQEQFNAIAKDVQSVKAKLPTHLFTEQATAELKDANIVKFNEKDIYATRRSGGKK